MNCATITGVPVSVGSYNEVVDEIFRLAQSRSGNYVCVLNVHMLVEAIGDASFRQVVQNAAVVTADGKPITWALRLIHGIQQDRVAGMFLMQDLLRKAEGANTPVFFYGGAADVLEEARRHLRAHYPALNIAGLISPPFRELSADEEEAYVQQINSSGARLVFVALGCPKQEKWMARMQPRINAVTVGVGAAVPVMVGMRKKAPMWVQNAGLEWLFRLCLEPRRLFKRYAVTNSMFLYLLSRELFKVHVLGKK